MPFLLLATPWDDALAATRSLYFSDVGFVSEPGDTPANTYWDRRIEAPLTVTQSLFAGTAASGRSDISAGAITIANGDGGLDALAGYDWDGRLIELRYTALARPNLADFAVVFSGTAERLVAGDVLQIEVRDLQILLDEPYQPARFLGTGGAEGPAEFKGRRKPRCSGRVRQFPPVLVVAALQIYVYSDGPVGGPLAVLDAGAALSFHADYASYAALAAASIPAGSYGTCNALGMLRLNATPTLLTIDADGAAPGGTVLRRFADLAQHIITTATTVTSGDFATGTVAALNALASQGLGHWYDGAQEATVRQVLDVLADSVGAFYGFDATRKLVLGRLDAPAGTPDFIFTARDMLDLAPLAADRRLKSQVVGWGRRLRPLAENEIAGAVTGTARTALIEEWRLERYDDAAVAAASLLAREERLDSAFDTLAEAQAEAQRRVTLYGPRRAGFRVTLEMQTGLRPGATVQLVDARHGLSAGRNCRVMRVQSDAGARRTTIEVWG